MGKPSIFSRDYEQRMKRRKLNLILFLLIIISAVFFGGKYYFSDIKINKLKLPFKFTQDKINKQQSKGENINYSNKEQDKTLQGNQNVNTSGYFDYKTSIGKIYKIEYTILNGSKKITNLVEDTNTVQFDISKDGQKIVFEDRDSGHIMLWDVNGKLLKISQSAYKTKSTGKILTMESIVKANPWFIWAQKPHFTNDGRIIYISHLPYIKINGNLYVWSANIDGSGHIKLGQLSNEDKEISKISYGGFDNQGNLIINSSSTNYYINIGSNELRYVKK